MLSVYPVDGDIQVERGQKYTSTVVENTPSLCQVCTQIEKESAQSGVPNVVKMRAHPIVNTVPLTERVAGPHLLSENRCIYPQVWLIIKSLFLFLMSPRRDGWVSSVPWPHLAQLNSTHVVGYPVRNSYP